MLGLERHVVGRIRGGLAVAADVGAVEREIAGVARPHPVVHFTAVIADAARRRIDQADVLDFQVAEQAVVAAAVKTVQLAAVTGRRLAFGDQTLFDDVARLAARQCVGRGHDGLAHLRGDIVDAIEHEDAGVRAGAQLIGLGGRVEAVLDQIPLRRRIELDRAVGAVVVGGDQPLRRDEAGGAAAQRDHCAQRVAGQVAELLGGELQAGGLQRAGDFRQLLRHPHAFGGMCGRQGRSRKCADQGGQRRGGKHRGCGSVTAHGVSHGSEEKSPSVSTAAGRHHVQWSCMRRIRRIRHRRPRTRNMLNPAPLHGGPCARRLRAERRPGV